jgi:hypothetical protein
MAKDTTLDVELRGMKVARVIPGGLGQAAGLKLDDVIVEVQGNPVSQSQTMRRIVDGIPRNGHIDFVVDRQGERVHLGPVAISNSLHGENSRPAHSSAAEVEVSADGRLITVRGPVWVENTDVSMIIDSVIPVVALTSAQLEVTNPKPNSQVVTMTFRVWDGKQHSLAISDADVSHLGTQLQDMVSQVRRSNAAWPMCSARAAVARAHLQVGLLRDEALLGVKGVQEFSSALSSIDASWAEKWRAAGYGLQWPTAAILAQAEDPATLVCLLDDSLVVIRADGQAHAFGIDSLGLPRIITGRLLDSGRDSIAAVAPLGLRIECDATQPAEILGLTVDDLQPLYRFLLYRWAEAQVANAVSVATVLSEGAERLQSGEWPPEAYAAVVDAAMATSSGVPLSRDYPPRERDYLKPPSIEATRSSSTPTSSRPAGSSSASAARQVAAGAAVGATVWNLLNT